MSKKTTDNQLVIDMEQVIRQMSSEDDAQIARAMVILLTALTVGPNVKTLIQSTGYSSDFISAIANRMREANLWINGLVDDRLWWDAKGELKYFSFFVHAKVALGTIRREMTPPGAIYTDSVTGELEMTEASLINERLSQRVIEERSSRGTGDAKRHSKSSTPASILHVKKRDERGRE